MPFPVDAGTAEGAGRLVLIDSWRFVLIAQEHGWAAGGIFGPVHQDKTKQAAPPQHSRLLILIRGRGLSSTAVPRRQARLRGLVEGSRYSSASEGYNQPEEQKGWRGNSALRHI